MYRPLPRSLLALIIILGVVRLAGPAAVCAPPAPDSGRAALEQVHGVRVFHVAGTPREMGEQVGRAFRGEIHLLHHDYLSRFVLRAGERAALTAQAREMLPFIPAEQQEEMRGVAEGAGMTFEEILFANCFLDLKRAPLCSTFVAYGPATADGGVLFGRNLDFPSLGVAQEHQLVLVYHPNGRKAFAAVGWPGFVGVLSGMNEDGLALAVMNVFLEQESPRGTPYILLFRSILEGCATTDEAVAFLAAAHRTVGNNLMLCDPRPSAALVEFSAEKCNVRRPVDGVVYATNHFRIGANLSKVTCWRYPILERELRRAYGALDVDRARDVLAQVGLWKLNLQAMVFRPDRRDLWVALGAPPACKGPYVHVPADRLWQFPAPAIAPAPSRRATLREPL